MGNVFHTIKEIHERYDIKGSKYKRKIKPEYIFEIINTF